ncbi:phage tail tape measure protein, TP901 family [Chryseobacterium sp. StRB126]|uniref:hypothetical protein n=1 Tax=Chryseobacterium sp. StRB126 TaxID=878220 RepID=UPI0004E9887E|nr:hypothetical protein [Chryseobacterium sp. StRB126]BAP30136.1 phage tail tape measure protein, TP901 family [Chryseobacterium sp. StRB126]
MAERINLGQFDIDTRQIDEKIASNRQKIDVLKDTIKDTQSSIKDYQKQIADVSKEIQRQNTIQDKANQDLANGVISQEEYNQITQEASRVIRDQEVNLGNLIQAERRQQIELNSMQNDVRSLTTENRQLNRALEAGATQISSSHGEYEQLKKDLADARQVAYDLGAEMMRLERSGETNTERYRQLRQEWRRASDDARELHDQILELETQTNDFRRNVGNYTNGIKDAFSEIGAGFTMLLTGGFAAGMAKIKDGLKSVKDGLIAIKLEMMSNPLLAIGIVLAALTTGFIQGMRAVFEYNAEVSKLNKEIEQLTNLSGPVVDKLREFATATEKVFGKDFKDGIQEMNSLMKDFNLTSDEAFKIYQEGLVKGGAANSEFGDSIREYGVLFAQNGYSAQEFLDLLNAGIDLDVYTDKLPDAIKEAGLSLNEQTKATRDALINAFGDTFSDDLLKRIRTGKTTIKQAVDEISIQAQKVGLNTQQIAQLNADVFKGAGEDAGGLVKIIDAVNLANSKETKTLTDSQKATIELSNATVELEKAKTEAFKSDVITGFTKGIELSWIKIKTVFVQLAGGLVDIVLWFDKLTGTSALAKAVFEELVKYGNVLIDALEPLKGLFNDLLDAIGINTDKTGGWIKAIMQTLNPLNLIKGAIVLLSAAVKGFGTIIENSRVLITTFALTAKSLFNQVISVAQDLKNLDFSSALNKLKSFSISNELSKARKEAEKIVALNKQKPAKEEEDTTRFDTKIKKITKKQELQQMLRQKQPQIGKNFSTSNKKKLKQLDQKPKRQLKQRPSKTLLTQKKEQISQFKPRRQN